MIGIYKVCLLPLELRGSFNLGLMINKIRVREKVINGKTRYYLICLLSFGMRANLYLTRFGVSREEISCYQKQDHSCEPCKVEDNKMPYQALIVYDLTGGGYEMEAMLMVSPEKRVYKITSPQISGRPYFDVFLPVLATIEVRDTYYGRPGKKRSQASTFIVEEEHYFGCYLSTRNLIDFLRREVKQHLGDPEDVILRYLYGMPSSIPQLKE